MIRIREIKIPLNEMGEDVLKKRVAHLLKIDSAEIKALEIKKEAIDARKEIFYVYEVVVSLINENKILKYNHNKNVFKDETTPYQVLKKENISPKQIIIVGTGPAGLFTAYSLVLQGYKPTIIERGSKIENRVKEVENFWETGNLNTECNVQFGEGGAGTFSDGKLNTLIKDSRGFIEFVLKTFVKFGAPKEILYVKNPHIGTDLLRNVIINMRKYIESLGGKFLYDTKLTNIIIDNDKVTAIEVNNKEKLVCDSLILAIGHSARDTYEMLSLRGLKMEAKPFAVGVRVMHKQSMINENQYKNNDVRLPNASYKLTFTSSSGRGVYSFCMCPGGYVVNASSEENRLAINGMSNYRRDSGIANSAIIVTISPKDFGNKYLDGINFQRKLEEKAYAVGGGKIPLQLWGDFKKNQAS